VKLPKILRGAPAVGEASRPPRRRRAVRPDGPKTIVPIDDASPASTPLARDLDAARERLRRAIPPVADDLD
jgi:hypothetical protein